MEERFASNEEGVGSSPTKDTTYSACAGMEDEPDLNPGARKRVRVQISPGGPSSRETSTTKGVIDMEAVFCEIVGGRYDGAIVIFDMDMPTP